MTGSGFITPVILSGGSGTRLWPLSRPERPKQFLILDGATTMLQATALRTPPTAGFTSPIIVAARDHADLVLTQLAAIGVSPAAIVLEPAARNTAPAIALAALTADPDAILLVMPSDHIIADVAAFHKAVARAMPFVGRDWLITFGIAPEAPETGYGWLRIGDPLGTDVFRVESFIEKPPIERARAMLDAGGHAWNGGIFMFKASAYLAALSRHAPGIHAAASAAMATARHDGIAVHPDQAAFESAPAISIDYAVMEKAANVAVVPVAMGWSDVGCWDALYALRPPDADGNVLHGPVATVDSTGCLVHSDGPRVALLGVEGLVVVVNGNDILVMSRDRAQELKRVTDAMTDAGRAPSAPPGPVD